MDPCFKIGFIIFGISIHFSRILKYQNTHFLHSLFFVLGLVAPAGAALAGAIRWVRITRIHLSLLWVVLAGRTEKPDTGFPLHFLLGRAQTTAAICMDFGAGWWLCPGPKGAHRGIIFFSHYFFGRSQQRPCSFLCGFAVDRATFTGLGSKLFIFIKSIFILSCTFYFLFSLWLGPRQWA